MSTVTEAAASLFGSDGDSGPDPFAVIGNEATDTTSPRDSSDGLQTHTPSNTSHMGQDASSWFAEQVYPDPQQEQHDPWFIPTAQDTPASRPGSLSSVYGHRQHSYPAPAVYQPPSHSSPPATTVYQNAPAYSPTPASPYQSHGGSQHSAQQPYEPYKPAANTSVSSSYTARRSSSISTQPQATHHHSRSPVSRSVSSPYSAALSGISQHPLPNGVSTPASKPPPAPTAAEFRPKVSNAYDPPLPPPKVHRTTSPNSVRFMSNSHASVSHISHPPLNPHDHKSMPAPPRTMSPSSIRSASPVSGPVPPHKSVPAYTPSHLRDRSASSGSVPTGHSAPNPPQPRKEHGLGFGAHISEPSPYNIQSRHSLEQDVHVLRSAHPPYAPSPSLLGSNDPLSRTSSRAPIISFGFGGKVLTCFHGSADLNTGFDVALSSRRTTNVNIRVLHQLLPDHAAETKPAEYPGPLFSDPGTPVASLVRTGASQVKTKKTRVARYLEDRAEEILRGTMYISDDLERQRLEGKLVLVQLLKIMVNNDGLLSGSPATDSAVRAALMPRIAGTADDSGRDRPVTLGASALTSPVLNAYGSTSMHLPAKESPVSVSILLPSALDKIEEFLVRGERRQAYHYALDQKLWAHALVIASSIDKDAWKEAVNEFLKAELGVRENVHRGATHLHHKNASAQPTTGRDWLRVTYSVFSGQGPSAVQELVPMNLLSRAGPGLQIPPPMLPHITPMSPSFPTPAAAAQIPVESLSKWPEIIASIVCSPLNPDYSATLSVLGDYLVSHNLVEGAHVCYLLSPQTSIMGGLGGPGTRLVLLGGASPHLNPIFFRDPDPIIFTEIAEFALSLKAPTKGQDPFHGLPHLQAYKFIRAAYLADIGHIQSATRYCESIAAAMGRHSPYFTPTLAEGLRQLTDRLLGSPHIDKSSSWISGKVNKPSLDSIGSWLEVRLTKFIAGEGNETSPSASEFSKAQFAGPFSSYSSITSATTSASPSPPPTIASSYSSSATQPPKRSGSAVALPSTTMHVPVDRASSAMEYYRPTKRASPAPPNTAPLHSTGYPYSPYTVQSSVPSMVNGYAATYESGPSSRKTSLEMTAEEGSEVQNALSDERGKYEEDEQQAETVDEDQETRESGGWWSSLSSTDSTSTPTAATFHRVDDARELGEGFISLMDGPALPMTPNMTSPREAAESVFDDEADDLGLGNSAHRRKKDEPAKMAEDKPAAAPVHDRSKGEEKQDTQPAGAVTGSWISRLWKRSDTPGPVRANLGEETSLYYDKEQKRWVNKKAGTEEGAQPSAPPPPPSRAHTASPSVSNSRYNGPSTTTVVLARPPPPRTASAIDLSTAKGSMRVRSNLVPPEIASMPNTPAPGSTPSTPPPMGRSRSQAAKKNVRSRYVDVFQQDESSGV